MSPPASQRWLTMTSFVAPLLRPCGRRIFVVHHGAETRSAKTALMRFAASVWCDPEQSVQALNGTPISLIERIAQFSDLPTFWDERESSQQKLDFSHLIYQISLGVERQRSKDTGGVQAPKASRWRTVVRTTGEGPIVGVGKVDRGGQHNRVLQFRASNFLDDALAEMLYKWTDGSCPPYGRHYGWGGMRFLQKLEVLLRSGNRPKLEALSRSVDQALDRPEWAPLAEKRKHLGSVMMAQYLTSVWILKMLPEEAWSQAISDAEYIAELLLEDLGQVSKHYEHGLDLIRDAMIENPQRWLDKSNPVDQDRWRSGDYQKLLGVIVPEKNELWLLQSPMNRMLQAEGIESSFWVELYEKGFLLHPDDRKRRDSTRKKTRGLASRCSWGVARRCYVLKLDRVNEGTTHDRGSPTVRVVTPPKIVMDI